MEAQGEFEHLLSPLRIGPRQARNRVLVTAHVVGLAEAGVPGEHYAAYHRERAAGGVGLQITGATPVHASSALAKTSAIENTSDAVIPGYRMLADAVHGEGGLILAQLAHYGATLPMAEPGRTLWSPSPQAAELSRITPHEMTVKEIAEVVSAFGAAAGRVRQGGLDGVEILGAFGLLIAAFMSPYSNKRSDRYGGSLENRLRFALEVIDTVRDAAGADLIVGMRIPGDEFVEGGLDIEAMCEIAQILEATGKLDYLNVIAGTNLDRINRTTHWPPTPAPHGLFVPLAAKIKSVVGLPVFTVGRIIDPRHAEQILRDGQADMVGMTRAHIADPRIVEKAAAGRLEDIRPCVGANVCIARAMAGGPLRCLYNPEAAREKAWGPLIRSKAAKRVSVIGGGPAGLEAARVAALRGHQVSLYEGDGVIGGQFALRAAIPAWTEFQKSLDWMRHQLQQLQVPVHLGRKITAAEIEGLESDSVILATGAEPLQEAFEGETTSSIQVLTPHAFLRQEGRPARNVLIWDKAGGVIASGILDAVAAVAAGFHVVTPAFTVAEDTDLVQRVPLYERVLSAGANFLPNHEVARLEQDSVFLRNIYSGQESRIGPIDTLISWTGNRARNGLAADLDRLGLDYRLAGDCIAPAQRRGCLRRRRHGRTGGLTDAAQ